MKKAHSNIVKGIITYEGRVIVFTNAMSPAAVKAQDQRYLISNYNSLRKFNDANIKLLLENFLKTYD